jgi:hypothetical protein
MKDTIMLYHGGKSDDVASLRYGAIDRSRAFFCTPHISLAQEAARSHRPMGDVLKIPVPSDVYNRCLEDGSFEEKPYLGMIQIEGCNEVIIRGEKGISILQEILEGIYGY